MKDLNQLQDLPVLGRNHGQLYKEPEIYSKRLKYGTQDVTLRPGFSERNGKLAFDPFKVYLTKEAACKFKRGDYVQFTYKDCPPALVTAVLRSSNTLQWEVNFVHQDGLSGWDFEEDLVPYEDPVKPVAPSGITVGSKVMFLPGFYKSELVGHLGFVVKIDSSEVPYKIRLPVEGDY